MANILTIDELKNMSFFTKNGSAKMLFEDVIYYLFDMILLIQAYKTNMSNYA